MKDYPTEGVIGAYTWLSELGYPETVDAIRNDPDMPEKGFRRLAVVGLIYEKRLIDEFVKTCWTQGNRNTTDRLARMDEFYRYFKYREGLVRWLNRYL